jgi:signal transduction histidine kinase
VLQRIANVCLRPGRSDPAGAGHCQSPEQCGEVHTPGGEIVLAVAVAVAVDGPLGRLSVTDNGSGISPDLLPHIFELFTQGLRAPGRSQGGLGLGLALVKSMVELHGSRL